MPDLFPFSIHKQFVRVARRIATACLVCGSLLALGGCTRLQVKMGMKVPLMKLPVTTMNGSLPKGPSIAPGRKSPLVVTFTSTDGKTYVTEGQGQGKIMWKDLNVTATVASVNKKGIVSIPRDPRLTDGKVPHVTISAPSHPDLHAELDVPVRYDVAFAADFSGSNGSNGADGMNGMNGSSGSMGSIDLDNPSPGGNGSDGTNGTDGSNGGSGGDAPPVQIRVALRSGDHPLLQIGVCAEGHNKMFLVDPQGGSLTVSANGGSGGRGGRGGRGGSGGSGGSGTPSGSSGHDGLSGQDGIAGSDGRGGLITVTYDPLAKPYLGVIHLSNSNGPRPVFVEQPVSALW